MAKVTPVTRSPPEEIRSATKPARTPAKSARRNATKRAPTRREERGMRNWAGQPSEVLRNPSRLPPDRVCGRRRSMPMKNAMTSPLLEVGQPVLVAVAPDEPPWRMVVDLVQDGHITLATPDDEHLPREWHDLAEVHLTCLGRFSVYLIHVPVVRSRRDPARDRRAGRRLAVQRRAYARVLSPVPVSCVVLDAETNTWIAVRRRSPRSRRRRLLGADRPHADDGRDRRRSSFALDDDGPLSRARPGAARARSCRRSASRSPVSSSR